MILLIWFCPIAQRQLPLHLLQHVQACVAVFFFFLFALIEDSRPVSESFGVIEVVS